MKTKTMTKMKKKRESIGLGVKESAIESQTPPNSDSIALMRDIRLIRHMTDESSHRIWKYDQTRADSELLISTRMRWALNFNDIHDLCFNAF